MNSAEIIQDYENKIQFLEEKSISLASELMTLQKRCEQYALAYDQLQHQLKEGDHFLLLKQHLSGSLILSIPN